MPTDLLAADGAGGRRRRDGIMIDRYTGTSAPTRDIWPNGIKRVAMWSRERL